MCCIHKLKLKFANLLPQIVSLAYTIFALSKIKKDIMYYRKFGPAHTVTCLSLLLQGQSKVVPRKVIFQRLINYQ